MKTISVKIRIESDSDPAREIITSVQRKDGETSNTALEREVLDLMREQGVLLHYLYEKDAKVFITIGEEPERQWTVIMIPHYDIVPF